MYKHGMDQLKRMGGGVVGKRIVSNCLYPTSSLYPSPRVLIYCSSLAIPFFINLQDDRFLHIRSLVDESLIQRKRCFIFQLVHVNFFGSTILSRVKIVFCTLRKDRLSKKNVNDFGISLGNEYMTIL